MDEEPHLLLMLHVDYIWYKITFVTYHKLNCKFPIKIKTLKLQTNFQFYNQKETERKSLICLKIHKILKIQNKIWGFFFFILLNNFSKNFPWKPLLNSFHFPDNFFHFENIIFWHFLCLIFQPQISLNFQKFFLPLHPLVILLPVDILRSKVKFLGL